MEEAKETKRARRLRRTRKALRWIWEIVRLGVDVARQRRGK